MAFCRLRSLTRCWKHDLKNMRRCVVSIATELASLNLCMRMQPTAYTLLCTAKHDCTMNVLRTGQSRDKGEAAGLAEDTFTIWPVLSKTCQALGPNQVAVVEQARHKHNT